MAGLRGAARPAATAPQPRRSYRCAPADTLKAVPGHPRRRDIASPPGPRLPPPAPSPRGQQILGRGQQPLPVRHPVPAAAVPAGCSSRPSRARCRTGGRHWVPRTALL